MLQLLETRLMQPEAVAQFIKTVGEEVNARNGTASAAHAQLQSERVTIIRKLEGLYNAIAEGLRTTGLKTKLEDLESRLTQIDTALSAPAPTLVRLHPNLSELYRRKVAELTGTLADPEIRTPALETICGLIEAVTVHGALASLLRLGPGSRCRQSQGGPLQRRKPRVRRG